MSNFVYFCFYFSIIFEEINKAKLFTTATFLYLFRLARHYNGNNRKIFLPSYNIF